MNRKQTITRRAAVASGAALTGLMLAACQGAAVAPVANGAHASPAVSSATTTPVAPATTAAPVTTATPAARTTGAGTGAASGPAPCGNGDLRTSWGHGTQSEPLQATAVLFTNVSDHTCTLQGYPGVVISGDGTAINATRVLNGSMSDVPHMSSPPLVTLAPGASAHAIDQWSLHVDQACYPTGTGVFEATAPNTTNVVTLGKIPAMGRQGICSGLEIGPVEPGTFGTP